uniref:Putative secreted protein n=1 Tax=Anopheles triannulatus TaxID=58253 RepID=A0A2M4B1A2_9DIPT
MISGAVGERLLELLLKLALVFTSREMKTIADDDPGSGVAGCRMISLPQKHAPSLPELPGSSYFTFALTFRLVKLSFRGSRRNEQSQHHKF